MIKEHKGTLIEIGILLAVGLTLITMVFWGTYLGPAHGKSLFSLAKESTWAQVGDLPAAWSSVKIIALSLGGLAAAAGFVLLLMILERRGAALALFVGSTALGGLGLSLGLFFLLKALL